MTFTERIEELLKERKCQKNKMLSDLNLGKNSFVNWAKRNNIPNGETLQKIANYFNVSVDYLLGVEKPHKPINNMLRTPEEEAELNEYLEALHNDPNLRMMFSLAKDAKKEDVEKAVAIIKAFLNKD